MHTAEVAAVKLIFWLGLRSHFTDSVSLVVLYISNDQSLRRKPDLERLVFY